MNQIIVTASEISEPQAALHERQQTEIALAESEAKFRSLVEDANDAISTWGLDAVLTYISPGMKIIFGYDPSEWLGQSFVPLVHPDDLHICMSANQQVIETGEKRSGVEFRSRHKDGHWVWVSMNISPVKGTDGKVIAFQGILRDINDRKQQENALRFIVEGTVSKTGAAFFHACVQNLAEIFEVKYAFITELVDETFNQSRMLAFWTGEGLVEPYEFDLAGTPCSTVFQEKWGIFPDALQARFPEADALATLGAESYLGVVIVDSQGKAIGNLGIMNTKQLTDNINTTKFILQIFAARVAAEMERYAAEVKLQEKEQFLRTVYEGANQPIFVIDVLPDDEFRYVGWNAAAEAASGMRSQDIRGKTPEEIYGIEVGKLERQRLQECLVSKQSVSYEECLTFDKKKSWWITTHNPIQDSNGMVYRFIGTTFDISDRKHAEAQLTQRTAELEKTLQELRRTQAQMIQAEKMSGLGQLVAGVAHEINNPVNFIYGNLNHTDTYIQDLLGLLELYQQHYPTPHPDIQQQAKKIDMEFLTTDLPKLLTSMKVGANRIEKIVASLRNFSRMDEAEMKEVNIHDGINSTLMILQHRLKAKSNFPEIKVIKNYGKLPLIECYAGKLNQVFMNLLTNAIDALEESFTAGTIAIPTITIDTFLANIHEVAIQITDNGLGIPNHVQERIFDPFFTTKPIGKGTGMGLSISYQIVREKHKGTLQCVSKQEQQGTTFIATIPTRQT